MDKKEREKLYYHENKEKRKVYNKEYRKNLDKEAKLEYSKNWSKNNRLRKKYHAGLYKISGYTYKEFETHLLNLGWQPNLHIDHKIPITHFSPDTPIRLIHDLRNLQVLTLKENSSKLNIYRDIVDKEYYDEVKKYLVATE
jgi:hypothetical protein